MIKRKQLYLRKIQDLKDIAYNLFEIIMPFISFSRSCCGKSAQKKKDDTQRKIQLRNKIEQNEFKQELLETKLELLDERNPQDGKQLLVIKFEIAKIRTENQKLRSAVAEIQTSKKEPSTCCCNRKIM